MAKTKLSPAEAHEILRRHAERLTACDAGQPSRNWRIQPGRFAPGDTIVPSPAWDGHLGLVVQGHVAVHTRQRGDDRPLVVLTPGHTFGPRGPVNGVESDATLKALVPTEIWFLCEAEAPPLAQPRKRRQRATVHWGRIGRAAAVLALCLAVLLIASIPAARSAVATLPMAIGEWCSQRGSYGCAERAWAVAAWLAPADARSPLALGILYYEQGDLPAAQRAFESANALAPDLPEALNNLGVVELEVGDYNEAARHLRKALTLDPGSAAVEQNLGRCLIALGAHGEALGHYLAALSLGTPEPGTLANTAIAYLGAGEPVRAEESARAALESDGASAPVYTVLGVVALESGQPGQALSLFQQAIALEAGYVPARVYMALAQLALGDTVHAREALEQALSDADSEMERQLILRQMDALEDTGAEEPIP